ncbi:unnamed protein product [Penicillium camemberti]|uniref:Str. FM013 n=1 Tax=Penicillium camemberti (strain FM 013) TaxID=1429867 RepID=A0A0G4NWD5_PENC3|nr:unnamed protein product [Penicillium camemberti]
MKRIPKAGRPLAKCSHLNGVDCNCREVWAIMVPLTPGSMVCSPESEIQPVQQQQVDHVYTEGR